MSVKGDGSRNEAVLFADEQRHFTVRTMFVVEPGFFVVNCARVPPVTGSNAFLCRNVPPRAESAFAVFAA
jgi:hypothetical protein